MAEAPVSSPVIPQRLRLEDSFQFRCHKGIACFNACCRSIDISLTPYDIVRLKNRLGLASYEFLASYTSRFDMDAHGMPGVKLNPKAGTSECQFLGEDGCGVYEDRPSTCRYYALGTVSMRTTGGSKEEDFYFLVKEPHCLGHDEPTTQTIGQYRAEQGVDVYDELNKAWRQAVLKKRSCGPTLGKPSERSLELFYLCSYDVDGLREFIKNPGFLEVFDLNDSTTQALLNDEVELMRFGFRILRQVLFGEISIPLKADAREKRLARRRALHPRALGAEQAVS